MGRSVASGNKPELSAGFRRKHLGERLFDKWERIIIRLNTAFIRPQFGACGSGLTVEPPFKYKNLQHVEAGENVMIKHYCWISAIASEAEPTTPKIIIGSHSHIGMGATISAIRRIVLGDHSLLARNVYISDHGHAFEDVEVPIALQGISDIGEVTVGEHSWIGQNVCILPGVTIGRHCVIGANSVVTRSLPDFSVAVGSPARVIKSYNPASRRWEKVSR